jgi:hypothetical protein
MDAIFDVIKSVTMKIPVMLHRAVMGDVTNASEVHAAIFSAEVCRLVSFILVYFT